MTASDNPFAGLDDYDLRHLVQHLDERNRVSELHKLLNHETAAGTNAWYEAQEATDGLASFASDVDRAWRCTQAQPWSDGPAKRLQLLYTLTLATLNSLAGNLPVELVEHMVATGLWTSQHGLAVARRIPDDQRRAQALCALAAQASALQVAAQWHEALDAVQTIANEARRGTVLASVGHRVPIELRDRVEALAGMLSDPDARATSLLRLAARWNDAAATQRMLRAAEAARQGIATAVRQTAVLSLEVPVRARLQGVESAWLGLTDEQRPWVLRALAPLLTPALLEQAKGLVLNGLSASEREHARCALSLRLLEVGEETAAAEVAGKLTDAELRGQCGAALCLARARAGDLDGAQRLADELPRAVHRVCALVAVAAQAPPEAAQRMLDQAARQLDAIYNLRDRAMAQAQLAQCLAARGEVQAAMAMVRSIELLPPRVKALVDLAPTHPEAAAELVRLAEGEPLASLANTLDRLALELRRAVLGCMLRRAREIADRVPQVVCMASAGALGTTVAVRALGVAEKIMDDADKAFALAALAGEVPSACLAQLERDAGRLTNATSAGRVLASLLPRQVAAGMDVVDAFHAAMEVADPEYSCKALLALVPSVPKDVADTVLQRVGERARAISDPCTRAEVLGQLASRADERLVEQIAPVVIDSVVRQVELYERGGDSEGASRVTRIVATAAPWFSMQHLEQLGAAVERLRDERYREKAFTALIERAVQMSNETCAQRWAGLMQAPYAAARARLCLLGLMPRPQADTERWRLADGLDVPDAADRARIYLRVAEQAADTTLKASMCERALAAIESMQPPLHTGVESDEDTEQPKLMLHLALTWKGIDEQRASYPWNHALRQLGRQSRSSALLLLPVAAKAIVTDAGDGTTLLPEVVQTVCRWWP